MKQTLKPLLTLLAIFGGLLTTPLGLLAAVALGPVILGMLCATLFGLIVFALWSGALGLALLTRHAFLSVRGRATRSASLPGD